MNSNGSIFDGTQITHNTITSLKGKAIYLVLSEATFKNCTFTQNFASNEFKNLYVILSTITIDNSTFTDDKTLYTSTQISSYTGGFIYIADSTGTITSSQFNGGNAGNGGAIFATLCTLTITGSTFTSNSAVTSGGAIYLMNNLLITLETSTFSNNLATVGDSIHLETSTATDSIHT
jgi:predicted outer membrane repeat protein